MTAVAPDPSSTITITTTPQPILTRSFAEGSDFVDLGLPHGVAPDIDLVGESRLGHGAVEMGQVNGLVIVVFAAILFCREKDKRDMYAQTKIMNLFACQDYDSRRRT